jgi:hypothetical protein
MKVKIMKYAGTVVRQGIVEGSSLSIKSQGSATVIQKRISGATAVRSHGRIVSHVKDMYRT